MRRSRPGLAYLLILPSLLLAFWIIGYPVYDVANTSLHVVNKFGQIRDFAGLANFKSLIAEPLFLPCLWRTLVWTVTVVGGTVLLSVPIAISAGKAVSAEASHSTGVWRRPSSKRVALNMPNWPLSVQRQTMALMVSETAQGSMTITRASPRP